MEDILLLTHFIITCVQLKRKELDNPVIFNKYLLMFDVRTLHKCIRRYPPYLEIVGYFILRNFKQ